MSELPQGTNTDALAELVEWLPQAAEGLRKGSLSSASWNKQAADIASRHGLSHKDGSWHRHTQLAWETIKGKPWAKPEPLPKVPSKRAELLAAYRKLNPRDQEWLRAAIAFDSWEQAQDT